MYYTVWNTVRRGHHKRNMEGDFYRVDPRKATQFAAWCQAMARAGELMTDTGDLHQVRVHDWGGAP